MANVDDEQHVQTSENDLDMDNTDSSTDDGSSADEDESKDESTPTEWLATGREKRSTAGNRMKSMLAAEEPDDDLELLFAEDEDDAGFTDVADDGSDVHMDSSSDDEDAQENADDLEGEKELEKQARERRQATRKRKAQEAIPVKFRKKVKIAPTASGSSAPPEPKSRPKKKSERISWLPSPADMPTRASKRETTMLSKEQLHQQMIEREVKRLKQVEAMEKKAKRMEALKKPPMTQAERLAEAAIVEKKNAKSLNRWEEAEKQREEERRAKLAALNNRTLDGPVVTFWSGVGEWIDGKLKHVGKIVTIEEKPVKKKRTSASGQELVPESPNKENSGLEGPSQPTANKVENAQSTTAPSKSQEPKKPESKDLIMSTSTDLKDSIEEHKLPAATENIEKSTGPTEAAITGAPASNPQDTVSLPPPPPPPPAPTPTPASISSQPPAQLEEPKPLEIKPPETKPANMRPPISGMYTTSMFAPPQPSQLMKPPEMKPPSNSFLAPPAGLPQSGLSMPMIGYHSMSNTGNSSTFLAPPNTAQRQSPLSMPQTGACPPPVSAQTYVSQPLTQPIHTPAPAPAPAPNPTPIPTSASASAPTPAPAPPPASAPAPAPVSKPAPPSTPTHKAPSTSTPTSRRGKNPLSTMKASRANSQKHQPKEITPSPPPSPPANGKATRNCIILQNFDENAVKEKPVQNRILFAKDMAKLSKPAPIPRCVITNQPARYRDPKTGLPYYNTHAFREIQKLWRGEYRWSRLVGAWIGSGSYAATGVPARFLNPDAPGPPKKIDVPESTSKEDIPESNKEVASVTPSASGEQKEQAVAIDTTAPTTSTAATLVLPTAPASASTSTPVSVSTPIPAAVSTAPSSTTPPTTSHTAPAPSPALAPATIPVSVSTPIPNPASAAKATSPVVNSVADMTASPVVENAATTSTAPVIVGDQGSTGT